jgi:uncharacterized protein YndB with AHSA1/START domain
MKDDPRGQDLVIERALDAPPDLVWKMWTRPEHFAAWYGPVGATISVATMDVRVGGSRLVGMEMTTPGGTRQMWFTGEYLEVVENRLLVYTDALSDERGHVMRPEQAGLPAGHPTTTEVRVELDTAGTGTRMRLTHLGIPTGSRGASGWAAALDNLAARLREQHG